MEISRAVVAQNSNNFPVSTDGEFHLYDQGIFIRSSYYGNTLNNAAEIAFNSFDDYELSVVLPADYYVSADFISFC